MSGNYCLYVDMQDDPGRRVALLRRTKEISSPPWEYATMWGGAPLADDVGDVSASGYNYPTYPISDEAAGQLIVLSRHVSGPRWEQRALTLAGALHFLNHFETEDQDKGDT